MTLVKFCGIRRNEDIEAVNDLKPDYIGFVFYKKSKRYVTPKIAEKLKNMLAPGILSVGVFVDEEEENVAGLLNKGIIDIAQLHGNEDEKYIEKLRNMTTKKIIRAFKIRSEADLKAARNSTADYILLDSGAGTGNVFDWKLIKDIGRPFFLAGGLEPENVKEAIEKINPFALDVSSGIETEGFKDRGKMERFLRNAGR